MISIKKVQLIKILKKVSPWYLLALTLILTALCVYALRANNEHMNQLRADVYAADKNGGNVQGALEKLAQYVTSNMNTNLGAGPNGVYPPIQLTNSYSRMNTDDEQALQQQNSVLYTQAEDYCQGKIPQGFSGRYRVPCIEQYVTSHGLVQANIPTALYEFDFISPTWSPDLAGWSLLAAIISALLTVASFIFNWRYKKKAANWQPKI